LIGDSSLSSTAKDRIHEDGLYSGTFASLIFAIITILANGILPLFASLNTGTLNHDKHSNTQRRSFEKFDLASVWMASHLFFAIAMFSTILVTSPTGATCIIGCVGLSWAMMLWAPFAIIGAEITKHNGKGGEDYDTGAILSLHNIAISAPQIVAALICSGVFWVAHQAGSSDAIGWALRVGGFAMLAAAWLCRSLILKE
jgi:solute carrier family 45 protein 1/2/4